MKTISLHTLKHTLKDIHSLSDNRKFCFVMGAGASYKSGIPTGGDMAKQWYDEMQQRTATNEFEQWCKKIQLNEDDLAAHYGEIYQKRFENDKASGYEFLVQAMRDAKPTFGHFVLAQILATAPGSCVLTPNFDSLIETSVYQYTDKTPLVCGHESLSGYARPSNIHPLIIKIHRDLLLSPKSDPAEIAKLDDVWLEPLNTIFSTHIPIVIGYGGNDGSLISYFEKMVKPSNFFWCGLKDTKPSPCVVALIEKLDGCYIPIDGFDEMMKERLLAFENIKSEKYHLDEISTSRVDRINKQFEELNKAAELQDSLETEINNKPKKELSAFEYSTMADNEPDYEKRKAIYLEALEHYPQTAWLWTYFTHFMHFVKKDYSDLEKYYLHALVVNSEDQFINGNYAVFLEEVKKDYDNADKFYLKALALNSENVNFIGNYANFLKEIKKDNLNAEKYYTKALHIDSNHVNNIENYAIFLHTIKKDYVNAEKYYLKAILIDHENSIINGNYAIFLYVIKKNYAEAEKYYLKSQSIDPENTIICASYGNFLHVIKKDYDKAEHYYLKALSIDPKDANCNGNFACLLLIINKKEEATKYLEAAFLNNNERNGLLAELWFYKYAHYPESIEETEKEIEQLLSEGVRSIGWDLSSNVETAIANGHPHPEKLKELATRITTQAE